MSNLASQRILSTKFERLAAARDIIRKECEALQRLHEKLPDDFDCCVDALLDCTGNVIVTGIGKAGWIGQKISATLASTGTPSHFLHPSEAMHGDLGRIQANDVVIVLSNSGETAEIVQLLPTFEKNQTVVIAFTARANSTLGKAAQHTLDYGVKREACAMGLAPSTSTTVMLALGDALALTVSQARSFQPTDFAEFHPGGSLGRKLSKVDDMMRRKCDCRLAQETETVRQVYTRLQGPKRRSGAILVVDSETRLTGLFTDSDLARLLEQSRDEYFDRPLRQVMTRNPITVVSGSLMQDAVELLANHTISELPVVNEQDQPLGLIDVTDVMALKI